MGFFFDYHEHSMKMCLKSYKLSFATLLQTNIFDRDTMKRQLVVLLTSVVLFCTVSCQRRFRKIPARYKKCGG